MIMFMNHSEFTCRLSQQSAINISILKYSRTNKQKKLKLVIFLLTLPLNTGTTSINDDSFNPRYIIENQEISVI